MIQKIKDFLTSIKMGVLYIIGPILALFAYIAYLRDKDNNLLQQIQKAQAEKQLADTLAKKQEADREASITEADYNTIRDQYLKQSGISNQSESDTKS